MTATCTSFLLDALRGGVHLPSDEYRLALIVPRPSKVLGADTSRYVQLGPDELPPALAYTRGGVILTGRQAMLVDGEPALAFDDAVWPMSTFQAGGALIFNASKDGRALCVLSFGGAFIGSGGPFRVPLRHGPIRLCAPGQ